VKAKPDAGSDEAGASQTGLIRQVRTILSALRTSPARKTLIWLVVALATVICCTSYGQIRLNQWNKPFYDALSRRDINEFMVQIGVFFTIAGTLLTLNVGQRWMVETLKLRMREGLVKDLVSRWMLPRRAFWLANSGPFGVNPDQRMHDDALKLTELSAQLGVGLFQASILLVSFSGVLWSMSAGFSIRIGGNDVEIPGYMLWAALTYATLGSLASYRVGRILIPRNADRFAREADLRFSLVRLNEHLDVVTLAGGEADERRRVEGNIDRLLESTRRLVAGIRNLEWITAGFGWTAIIAPTLVAAPLYLTGQISFGGMMMAVSAFNQAQSSLRWFVDNFSHIAEWRATLLRVANFRLALTADDLESRHTGARIDYPDRADGTMAIDSLVIRIQDAEERVTPERSVIEPGERVLISAAPATNKTLLFRALAGLWPWGGGQVGRPADANVMFLPRGTPYLPTGTLREALCYPVGSEDFDDGDVRRALDRIGLARLAPLLDETRRWDRDLNVDEQLGLAYARVLLHAPAWLIIDDGLGGLDSDTLARVVDIFTHELAGCAILHIGQAGSARDALFGRELLLERVEQAAAPAPAGSAGDDGAPA